MVNFSDRTGSVGPKISRAAILGAQGPRVWVFKIYVHELMLK